MLSNLDGIHHITDWGTSSQGVLPDFCPYYLFPFGLFEPKSRLHAKPLFEFATYVGAFSAGIMPPVLDLNQVHQQVLSGKTDNQVIRNFHLESTQSHYPAIITSSILDTARFNAYQQTLGEAHCKQVFAGLGKAFFSGLSHSIARSSANLGEFKGFANSLQFAANLRNLGSSSKLGKIPISKAFLAEHNLKHSDFITSSPERQSKLMLLIKRLALLSTEKLIETKSRLEYYPAKVARPFKVAFNLNLDSVRHITGHPEAIFETPGVEPPLLWEVIKTWPLVMQDS